MSTIDLGQAAPGRSSALAGDKRLIFTVTTGRSGTEYLARCLALFRGVHAAHEPKPRFSSTWRAILAARDPHSAAREFWLAEKLPRIRRTRGHAYAETSHLACKGFLESLADLGIAADLVHLRRDPRAVATSLWHLGAIPGRTLKGVKHFLSPWDPNHLAWRDLEHAKPSDYQLCYWYALECDARAAALRATLEPRGLRMHSVDIESLWSEAGILELGRRLDLGTLSTLGRLRIARIAGRRVNTKAAEKRPQPSVEAELDLWEREVRASVGLRESPASP
jgi:hypothetical protein